MSDLPGCNSIIDLCYAKQNIRAISVHSIKRMVVIQRLSYTGLDDSGLLHIHIHYGLLNNPF